MHTAQLKERFSSFVKQHIVPPGDGADVITMEDLYRPEILSLSDSAMVHPAIVFRHQEFCRDMGIEFTSRKKALASLNAYIAFKYE